ncbi:MAG: hypothetical protein WCI31_09870 [Prolixibacteraceae bacterium]
MKKICWFVLTAILLIVQISTSQSQVPVLGSETLLEKLRLNKGLTGPDGASYVDIVGDPYLFKNFTKGKLILTDGKTFDIIVRYDIYANQIHFKVKNEIFAIIHPENLTLIEADSLKFVYSKYVKSGGEDTSKDYSYFILKTDGVCKLLIKKQMRIQDAVPPQLYQEAKPARFILTNDSYYLKLQDKPAVRIRNEKELLIVLAARKDAIASFIHSNKLNAKEIEDIVKIVSYYNKL